MRNDISLITILCLIILAACDSEQAASEEEPANEGMGWTHENPVTPDAGTWESIDFKDGSSYSVEPPPANDSEETQQELEELRHITSNLTEEEIAYIDKWAHTTTMNTLWLQKAEELIDKYELLHPVGTIVHAALNGAIYTGTTATYDEKYHYKRPRPTDLDPSIQVPEEMSVPAHPAYPAGHSSTAWVSAYMLSYFFPNEREELEELAASVAYTREQMGVHFKSDNEASKALAQDIVSDVIEQLENNNVQTQFTEVNTSGGH